MAQARNMETRRMRTLKAAADINAVLWNFGNLRLNMGSVQHRKGDDIGSEKGGGKFRKLMGRDIRK